MEMTVASRRLAPKTLEKRFEGAMIIDVTSRASEPWVQLSPFYAHGGIPVPFSPGRTSESVEGIWQALKVFESADVDASKLDVTTMKGLKRTVRKHGSVRGHRRGLKGKTLLSYVEARREIYLPSYRFVLENHITKVIAELKRLAKRSPLVLLDYGTNGDIEDVRKPLSHAALVRAWLMDEWPA